MNLFGKTSSCLRKQKSGAPKKTEEVIHALQEILHHEQKTSTRDQVELSTGVCHRCLRIYLHLYTYPIR